MKFEDKKETERWESSKEKGGRTRPETPRERTERIDRETIEWERMKEK